MLTQLTVFFEALLHIIDFKTMFAMLFGGLIPLFIARHMFNKNNNAARLKDSRDACVVLIKELGEIRLLLLQAMNQLTSADGKQDYRISQLNDKMVALENQIMIFRLISTENVPEQFLLTLANSIEDLHAAIDALRSFDPTNPQRWMEVHEPQIGHANLLLGKLVFKVTECFRPVG
jgi:hypothetical protein